MKLDKKDKIYIKKITGGFNSGILSNPHTFETELRIISDNGIERYQEEERMEYDVGEDDDGNLRKVDENGNIVEFSNYWHKEEPPMTYYRDHIFLDHKKRFWSEAEWELEKIHTRRGSDEWCKDMDALDKIKNREKGLSIYCRQSNKMENTL